MNLYYGRNTEAGIRRIAMERGLIPEPKPKLVLTLVPKPEPIVEIETQPEPAFEALPRNELKHIIDLIARMHGVTYKQVISKGRVTRIAQARQAAMCAVKQARPGISLPKIGRLFDRDHTTVIASMQRRGFK